MLDGGREEGGRKGMSKETVHVVYSSSLELVGGWCKGGCRKLQAIHARGRQARHTALVIHKCDRPDGTTLG